MTYEEIVAESINNVATKEELRRSLKSENKPSAVFKITQELLRLAERNEAWAKQQFALLLKAIR